MDAARTLTTEQIEKIDKFVAQVAAQGFGSVTIVIERGRVRWVQPTESHDLSSPQPETRPPL